MVDISPLLQKRVPKIFQCNFASGPSYDDLLGVATMGLSQINDAFTGRPTWVIPNRRPLPVPGNENQRYVTASAFYPVSGIGGTVQLGMSAISEDSLGMRLVMAFTDSMGWDVPSAESSVNMAMKVMSQFLQAQFPMNSGWHILQGEWCYAHGFQASPVTASPPPETVIQDDELPDDFYTNSKTGRPFMQYMPGVDANAVIKRMGSALADTWNVEYSTEDFNGMTVPTFEARNRAWAPASLYALGSCQPNADGIFLTIMFGDKDCWTSPQARDALDYSVGIINTTLGITLDVTPPSNLS